MTSKERHRAGVRGKLHLGLRRLRSGGGGQLAETAFGVGVWTIFKGPGSRRARYRFTWPLGRLDLDDEQSVLSVRGPPGKLFAIASRLGRVEIPVVVPIRSIRQVEVREPRGGFGFRVVKIRCQDPDVDGVEFGSLAASTPCRAPAHP
jgi:hypothetical protein